MFNEVIDNKYRVYNTGGSKGTQIKYKFNDFWYKEDNLGCEGLVEYLVSLVLRYSSLSSDEYVIYDYGTLNNKNGCRSLDFTDNGRLMYNTLQKLYCQITGFDLYEKVSSINCFTSRRDFILDFFNKYYRFDLYDYFSKVFSLDLITLNEDRHFNNLGILVDINNGTFSNSPIFDNGMSLLNGNYSVNRYLSIDENTHRVTSKPFSGSPLRQYELFSHGFYLDYIGLFLELESLSMQDNFHKTILYHQLIKYKDKFFRYTLSALVYDGLRVGTRVKSCGSIYDTRLIIHESVSDFTKLEYVNNEYFSNEELRVGDRFIEVPDSVIKMLWMDYK